MDFITCVGTRKLTHGITFGITYFLEYNGYFTQTHN